MVECHENFETVSIPLNYYIPFISNLGKCEWNIPNFIVDFIAMLIEIMTWRT